MPNFHKPGNIVSLGMRSGAIATPQDVGSRRFVMPTIAKTHNPPTTQHQPKPTPPVTTPRKVGNHPPTGKWDPSKWGKGGDNGNKNTGGGNKKPKKPKPPKPTKSQQPPWWTYLLSTLNGGNSGLGTGDQGLGSLGAPTVIPAAPGASGGGVSVPLVIGGVSVAGALLLLLYEWWRHKHAKEEAGRA